MKKLVNSNSAVWIAWENHRRTQQLADELGIEVKVFHSKANGMIRYTILITKTIFLLLQRRPRILLVQNPSFILTVLACLLRRIFKYRLIVDRHTNFRLGRSEDQSVRERTFRLVSNWTLRKADLTIVTNEFLKNYVNNHGGLAYVLQDKIPSLDWSYHSPKSIQGKYIVFVSSFAKDEPVKEVINASGQLIGSLSVAITGRFRSSTQKRRLKELAPSNVIFTGFLDDTEYLALLQHAELVMVLTTIEHCLTCGAYEAVSAGKAMVLSDTQAIREYFSAGAVYCKPTAESIITTITDALSRREQLESETKELRSRLVHDWSRRLKVIDTLIFGGQH